RARAASGAVPRRSDVRRGRAMRLPELVMHYALVGAGCAVTLVAMRGGGGHTLLDAAMLVPLWPLYGPFLVAHGNSGEATASTELLRSLARARGTPMAAFLPDETAGRALAER